MSTTQAAPPIGVWKLPPVILHPFAGDSGPDRILAGSRAHLALHGMLPGAAANPTELSRTVLLGRYHEMRMLFYIGKDLQRWTEQCVDFASRDSQLRGLGLREQSFAALLVDHPPLGINEKLGKWGITSPRSIFSRAFGLIALLAEPPEISTLSSMFVEYYQRFADYLFICYRSACSFPPLAPEQFQFEIYASDEYAKMLEDNWR